MDPAKRKTLDQLLWKGRLKIGLRMIAVLIPALAFIAFVTFDLRRDGAVLEAQILERYQPVYRASQWVVALEDGRRVRVQSTGHLPFERGRKVLVRERIGRIFGRVSYEFHAYAETAGTDR